MATAARINFLKAAWLSFSPSRMSMARRVFPSRVELNSLGGPGGKGLEEGELDASWDQTGVRLHFHSCWTSGSAWRISPRTEAGVSPLQSPGSSIFFVMFFEASLT